MSIASNVDILEELVNKGVIEVAELAHDVLELHLIDETILVLVEHVEALAYDLVISLLLRRHLLHAITELVKVDLAVAVRVDLNIV